MNILYHLTFLPPKMPECVADLQEVNALCRHFGGSLIYVNPNSHSPVYLPRLLFGFHLLRELRKREAHLTLHHVYNPDPFPFPILRLLRQPVVYSLTGGVERRPNLSFFASLAAITVSDEASLERLRAWGLDNVHLVRTGIETGRFRPVPLPLRSEICLMVGSAPWTRAQFRSKGVDALLLAAQSLPRLRLVFLWRGALLKEMERRVRRMELGEQVQVLSEQVDVNQTLAGVHASVALAANPGIIKAYPHSLLDSLAAGKPVLVSRAIPMADYVERTGCGVVVEDVDPASLLAAIEALSSSYAELQAVAQQVGPRDFTLDGMLASFQRVYEGVLGQ